MFEELDVVEKIGTALQGEVGLAGQIGWGLLAIVGMYKIFTAVAAKKMDWGEAGKKLEKMFNEFQWRIEGGEEGKGGGTTIKAIDGEGNTIYSYANGRFALLANNKHNNLTTLISRKEAKRLAKLRKGVVANLLKKHKDNSTAAILMDLEKFLNPQQMVKALPVAKPVVAPVVAKMVEASKPVVAPTYQNMPVRHSIQTPVVPKPAAVVPPVAKVEVPKPVVAAPVAPAPKPVEVKKVVFACPKCRTNRAIVSEGANVPHCPECKVGKNSLAPLMTATTADAKEFIDQNTAWTPAIKTGSVFKNYKSTNGKFVAQPYYSAKLNGFELCKQPSESFKDQTTVAMYKELKEKAKEVAKAEKAAKNPEVKLVGNVKVAEEPKLVSANQLFANKIETPKLTPAPVVAPVDKIETPKLPVAPAPKPVVKSDYSVYCCPKCRITRAVVKNGHEANLTCKNDECNGEKLVKTTANAEEFVLENGMKVTDYLKSKNLTSVRLRNYGSKDGSKYVAVLLPMGAKAPQHAGQKMEAKKQPSDSIVGYVKPVKVAAKVEAPKPAAKTVDLNSKVVVEYATGPQKINTTWNFAGNEASPSWKNVREMMKGMKAGETRIIPACKDDNGAYNEQFTVTVKSIA